MLKFYTLKNSPNSLVCIGALTDRLPSDAQALALEPYIQVERESFIRDYTHLIATLNAKYKDQLLWWATDLSSKNGYFCSLPDLILELLEIEKVLKAYPDQPLWIVSPSIGIYKSLHKLCGQYGRKLIWPAASFQEPWERIKAWQMGLLRLLMRSMRFYLRSIQSRLALHRYAKVRLSKEKEFYVVKTFSYDSSWDKEGHYTDSYFGRLPRFLVQEQPVVILSYHWQGLTQFLQRIQREKDLVMLPVEFFLKTGDFIRAIWEVSTFRISVDKSVDFRGMDIADTIRFELRSMNGIQVFQLLHHDATCRLLKDIKVKTWTMTFENNPWERMCMLALRRYSPATKILGYQHSVVPEAALNMFVHPSEKNIVPLPDKILTTGDVPKDILQHYGDYGRVPLVSACALRYEYLSQLKPAHQAMGCHRLLAVLDGVEQTHVMLKYLLSCTPHPSYRLRIRCHPALPWEVLAQKFHVDMSTHPQIEVSKAPLGDDFAWADAVMYWQSTVVLEAVGLGKPVINFKPGDVLSYDPLFQIKAFKWIVTPETSLIDTINIINQMDQSLYSREFEAAIHFLQRYFHPVSPETLRLFVV